MVMDERARFMAGPFESVDAEMEQVEEALWALANTWCSMMLRGYFCKDGTSVVVLMINPPASLNGRLENTNMVYGLFKCLKLIIRLECELVEKFDHCEGKNRM